MLKRLFIHISNYSLSGLAVTLAGFISFPLLTRLLTPEEYGLLSLIAATLTVLVAIGKLGMQHSAVRFYSQAKSNSAQWGLPHYYTTMIVGMGSTGLIITLIWLFISYVIPVTWWNDHRLHVLFMLTSILILLRVFDSTFSNILRAQERSGILSIYAVVKRYVTLAMILGTLFFINKNIEGLYHATIVAELFALMGLSLIMLRSLELSFANFSLPLLKAMLWFGIPMIGYEVAAIILSVGDRYVIQFFLGSEQLGAYSAAYNLCEYVQGIIIASLATAALPMYLRIWEESGEQATIDFINQSLHYYMLVGLPVVGGLCAVGSDLLTLLASEKYITGASIIPYVISGMIIDGAMILFGAGLYIRKQSLVMMLLVAAAAAVNIILNIILVPVYGIQGAAMATLVSFLVLALLTSTTASKVLRISFPWTSAAKFSVFSLCMYLVLDQIKANDQLSSLIIEVCVGALFYTLLVALFDTQARQVARGALARLKRA